MVVVYIAREGASSPVLPEWVFADGRRWKELEGSVWIRLWDKALMATEAMRRKFSLFTSILIANLKMSDPQIRKAQ